MRFEDKYKSVTRGKGETTITEEAYAIGEMLEQILKILEVSRTNG